MNKNKTLKEQENKKTYQERSEYQEQEQKDNCYCCKEWQRGYFGYASYMAGKRKHDKFLWY